MFFRRIAAVTNSGRVYMDLVGRGKSEVTARRWAAIVVRFEACCGVKGRYSRDDVVRFLVRLREDGLSQNSINTVIRPVKLLCSIQGWKGGFPKLCMGRVRGSDVNRPLFTMDDMRLLVSEAKRVCSRYELALLAVASTYGLRRGEIGTLKIGDRMVR